MKYAHIENNKLLGWYDSDIHSEIPTPSIEVSEEDWQEAIDINANYYDEESESFIAKDLRTEDEVISSNIASWKANRKFLVSEIEVEYDGNIYQGDETSQDRMSRALNGLPDDGSIYWRTKDNSKVSLTKVDLRQILYLAGQKQTEIWFEEMG